MKIVERKYCNIHIKGMVVMCAFSDGDCSKCDEQFSTEYTPCNKVCDPCSSTHNICAVCGNDAVTTENDAQDE